MSRRAIRNMNTLYPDATEADLASGTINFLHKTSIGVLNTVRIFSSGIMLHKNLVI